MVNWKISTNVVGTYVLGSTLGKIRSGAACMSAFNVLKEAIFFNVPLMMLVLELYIELG